ncbi:MAG: ABC transporter substrate-binding protein [Thermomicrobiales bacterium]
MKRIARFRRYAALALLALIVPSLLAACGGSTATNTPAATKAAATTGAAPTTAPVAATTAGSPAVAATTAPATAASPAASGTIAAAKPGGQIIMGRNIDDLITFDPGHVYEISSNPIMGATYETLVFQNPPDVTKYTPVLAKEVPTTQNGGVSADGKTYTFHLRDNVKFHTGNTMTAADWVFSLTRLHFLSDNPSFLADPFSTDTAVNVKAVDPATVQFTLAAPNVAFLSYLSTNNSVVLDSKAVMAKGGTDASNAKDTDKAKDFLDQNSAGTGPFILKSFKIKDQVVMDKNPNYWGTPAKYDRFILKQMKDSGTEQQQLEAGAIDIANDLDPDAVAQLVKTGKYTIVKGNTLDHVYLALNVSPDVGGILANKLVRQAIGFAIDYDGIINGLLKGAAVRPPTIIPLGLLSVDKVTPMYKTDLTKAKDLIKQANAVGQTIKLTYGAGDVIEGVALDTLAPKLKADIEQTGLKVDLVPEEPQQRLADYRAGKLQFTVSSWSPDYVDVHTYADPFTKTGGAAAKRVKYSNPAVDALLAQGLTETDGAKRSDIYAQIQKIVQDDAPFLVLEQPVAQIVMTKAITGYIYHPVDLVNPYLLAKAG